MEEDTVYDRNTVVSTYILLPKLERSKQEKLRDTLDEYVTDWPSIDNEPSLSDLSIQFLATMSFPTLFRESSGDPTSQCIL